MQHQHNFLYRTRTWCIRNIAWSHDLAQFCREKDGPVVDAIPLSEVELVQEMNDDSLSLQSESKGHAENVKNYSTFQIKTVPDGYNSGRTYYLRTMPDPAPSRIIQKLREGTNAARKRAVVMSRFKQAQKFVRQFHDSTFFQVSV